MQFEWLPIASIVVSILAMISMIQRIWDLYPNSSRQDDDRRLGPIFDQPSRTRAAHKLAVKPKVAATRCVFCHDDGADFTCECGAVYHDECLPEIRRCATLGCESPLVTRMKVQKLAHSLWEEAGKPHGKHEDHWLEAERRVRG